MTTPERRAVAGVFGRSAETYDTVIPFFARFGERLVDAAPVQRGDRVADLACGAGASAVPAARRAGDAGRVVAVDVAPEMVARVRARAPRNVVAVVGDATAPPLALASFDVVLCGFSVMFLPGPGDALARWRALLTPGGRCAVSMPSGAGPQWDFFGELVRRHARRAVAPLAPPPPSPDLGSLLQRAGFAHVEVAEVTERFTFAGPNEWWRWTWSHGARAILEAFPPAVVEELRDEAFEHLTAMQRDDGIPLDQRAVFARARVD